MIQDILKGLINTYGEENFLALAKKVIDEDYRPQIGLELQITALSTLIAIFENAAMDQNKTKEMTLDEIQKTVSGN